MTLSKSISTLLTLQFLLRYPIAVFGQVPYPKAQPCFDAATSSAQCDQSNSQVFNACACSNKGNWLGNSAKCIGQTDADEVTTIYNSLNSNCAGTNTPIAYSLNQWLAAANVQSSSSSSARSTSSRATSSSGSGTTGQPAPVVSTVTLAPTGTQSSAVVSVLSFTPGSSGVTSSVVTVVQSGSTAVMTLAVATGAASSSSGKDSGKLGTGAIVGIALGIPIFVALAGFLLFFLFKKRRDKRRSQVSDISEAYDPNVQGNYGGLSYAGKKGRPLSTGTALSEPVSQPQSEYGGPSRYDTARPFEPRHHVADPNPGSSELQGPPVRSAHELGAY